MEGRGAWVGLGAYPTSRLRFYYFDKKMRGVPAYGGILGVVGNGGGEVVCIFCR